MSASNPHSDKLTRPVADVLRNLIRANIISGNFRRHRTPSDPDLERFKLDSDPTTLKRCSSYVTKLLAAQKELDMYEPLAKLLTEISCFVNCMQIKQPRTSALADNNSMLMFITRSTSVQEAVDGELVRLNIAGVAATTKEVEEYLDKDDFPKRHSSLHWYQCLSVGKAKLAEVSDRTSDADFLQLLSHVWCANRYQPYRFNHTAILAYKNGFITLKCSPDSAIVSSSRPYTQYGALVQYVYDVYYPYPHEATATAQPLEPFEFANLKPILSSEFRPKKKAAAAPLSPSFRYADGNKTNEYEIFDLFHGSGFGRQAYVGLGAKTTKDEGSPQAIVFKVYCRERVCHFREEELLEHIHKRSYLPGVVRICKNMLDRPFVLLKNDPTDPVREACMIPLATTGESLSMCKNVLQFLKAMYDLTEVHRMLVERDVLHCDISWANILINHSHFEGPVDGIKGLDFIDNILGELEPRVQAVLTDFDTAMVIRGTEAEQHDLDRPASAMGRGITGTPAFIAEVLAHTLVGEPEHSLFQRLEGLNRTTSAHPVEDRERSDVEFFKEMSGYSQLNNRHVSHQAIHDAESIFWIIVFFMTRANPRGSDSQKSIDERSRVFDGLVGNEIGSSFSSRASIMHSEVDWANILPEEMKGFSEMIRSLLRYFSLPWHGIEVPPPHQFHAHNFLQRLLFREIKRLNNNPIELELVPLPVISRLELTQFTTHLKSAIPFQSPKRPLPEDDGGVTDGKRRKHQHSQADGGRAPSTADNIFTAAAEDATVASPVSILPLNVPDEKIRSMIERVRTTIDVQKLWFTGNPEPSLPEM